MATRKRILYYSHTRQVSGGERVLLTMLDVLDRKLYEPVCACPFEGPGDLDAVLRTHGETVIEVPVLAARFTLNPIKLCRYLLSIARAMLAFRRTVNDLKPDLLHCNSVRAGIVATLATLGTGTMILWHLHDDLPAHPISTIVRQLAFRSSRSRFVAVSHHTARVFAGGLPFGFRLQVLHNAVDTARFPRKTTPLDAEAQAFRDELGVAEGDFLAVAVGMINPRKRQVEVVEAWHAAQKSLRANEPTHRKAHLTIVGAPIFNDDHLYARQVEEAARREADGKSIHIIGARPDIPAVLRAADVLVLNAATEPFGLVLLEAIASRTAVIAAEVGGIPEIVTNDVTGILLTSTRSVQADLAHQLVRAYWSPGTLAGFADRAYTDVLPQFTVPVFAANLAALYTSLNL